MHRSTSCPFGRICDERSPAVRTGQASRRARATAINGAGELTGFLQISEWGLIETPIFLTSTMAVGRVFDGAVDAACEADSAIGTDEVVIPVVGECDDSWLDESSGLSPTAGARAAREQGRLG